MLHKNITKLFALASILLIAACTIPAHAKTVNAAKMPGFNPANATKALQAALDSGADKVIVPDVGKPWIVTPLQLRSNQTVIFKPGVVILAKKGKFHGLNDSLFTASGVKNLTIIGDGATWRMHKKDYANPKKYKHAEWRMGLKILGSSNVTIEGLTIEKTGGDGIYISGGSGQSYSKNITIRNVILYDNYRQGISVISADHLRIENVIMRNTGGTPPMAGIDFEPNRAGQRLSHIVMKDCLTWGNHGSGYALYLVNLNRSSEPVSIHIEDCRAIGDNAQSVTITTTNDVAKAPKGQVTFEDCVFRGSKTGGIKISKPAKALKVVFDDCKLIRPAMDYSHATPIQFSTRSHATGAIGGVVFDDFKIIDPLGRKSIGYVLHRAVVPLKKVTGNIIVKGTKRTQHFKLSPKLLKKWSPGTNFAKVSYINLSKVTWLASAAPTRLKLNKATLRKHAQYALYAGKGDKVKVEIKYGQIGRYSGKAMKVDVTAPLGKSMYARRIPFKKITAVSFIAPKSGLYQLNMQPGANYCRLVTSTNPIAMVTPKNGFDMNGSGGNYYFWVPKGTKQLAIRGSGSGNEAFGMTLVRPDGTIVKSIKKIIGMVQITGKTTPSQTGQIWKLKLAPAPGLFFGDHSVKLLGVPPLLSTAPQAVIRSK